MIDREPGHNDDLALDHHFTAVRLRVSNQHTTNPAMGPLAPLNYCSLASEPQTPTPVLDVRCERYQMQLFGIGIYGLKRMLTSIWFAEGRILTLT
jgi:hypothetical protein